MSDPIQAYEMSNADFTPESRGDGPQSLASAAAEADERAGNEIDLALTWRELVQGLTLVAGTFFSASRCGVVLAATEPPLAPRLSGRRLEIIEAMLAGASQNAIAIEMELASSTVALHARLALECLGVRGRPSRVHPLPMLAATLARNGSLAPGTLSYIRAGERDLRVVGMPRPERRLVGVLPPAELAVVACLVEGCCYAEIAERRRTSERTIANQIAAVFRRLQISGRSELLQRLFAIEGMVARGVPANLTPPPPPPPPTVRYPRPFAVAEASRSHT